MAGVNVKMGVTGVSEFKRGIKESEEAVKTLNSALKLNETQLKETGDKEVYLSNKIVLMKRRIAAQEEAVKKAEEALKSMKDNGVETTSTAFQNMQQKALDARTKLSEMRTELKNVKNDTGDAKSGTEKMNKALGKIGEGIAWDNVTKGIEKITNKLKSGAQAAVRFGKKIVDSAKESTQWADDLLTKSAQTGIDVETLQKMEKVADFIDTDVDAIINAKKRMMKAAGTKSGKETLEETLGLSLEGTNPEDLFWEVGEALLGMSDAFDKEEAAQKMFGRSWDELLPLFKAGREEYERMLNEQTAMTDEQVKKLGEADDAIKKVEQQIKDLKNELWSEYIDKITGLMDWVLENKDAVYDALKVIAAGFGLLKLGETATNIMQFVNGLKELKLLGGGKVEEAAADAASSAASSAGTGATAGSTGGIGATGMLGIGGVAAIAAGFLWAANQRKNHSDQVRGTEANLEARTAGAETILADYIRAQKAMNELDWSATEEDVTEIQSRIDAAYKKLQEIEGGQEALQAYSDWRQEHSYGNMDWVMPEYLENARSNADEQTENDEKQRNIETAIEAMQRFLDGTGINQEKMEKTLAQMRDTLEKESRSENATTIQDLFNIPDDLWKEPDRQGLTSEDVYGFKALPAMMRAAVQAGISNIKVVMDGQTVGNLVTPFVSQNIARDIP